MRSRERQARRAPELSGEVADSALRARLRRVPGLAAAWGRIRRGAGRAAAIARAVRRGAPPAVSLGVEVAAAGPRARAVFGEFAPPRRPRSVRRVDVVLADADACAAGLDADGAPVVALTTHPGLAVPAFDPTRWNPVGWLRDPGGAVGALGDRRLLPPGVATDRRVSAADPSALRRCHHVEDVAAFHPDPDARAGVLVRLAALGVPVCLADGGDELRPLLGAALHGLMTRGVRAAGPREREILSVRLRRLALEEHTLRARARGVCGVAAIEPRAPPSVSVVLATRRPRFLEHALAGVARQDHPRLELVLALHGDGFPENRVRAALARLAMPVTVVRVPAARPLGAVLQAAAAVAGGTYLTKMDDDDVYAACHLRDLVAARVYSGAELVGKYVDVAYLVDVDRTVEIGRGVTERYGLHVTGSALLVAAEDLDRVGGWRLVASGVDVALREDIERAGGKAYRTHGMGVVRVRHGRGHARHAGSRFYLDRARAVHAGWRPELAGMPGACRPSEGGTGHG